MALKNPLQDGELVVRAPVVGHIPKGVWVVRKDYHWRRAFWFRRHKGINNKNLPQVCPKTINGKISSIIV